MKDVRVGRLSSRANVQRAVLVIALFLVMWQLIGFFSESTFHIGGFDPIYPDAALDVVFLLLAGWRFWPAIPVSGVISWMIFDHFAPQTFWTALLVQVFVGGGFALAVRYVVDVKQIRIPPRSITDISWLCGGLGIVAPLVAGLLSSTAMIAFAKLTVDELPSDLSRFVLGDATSVVVLVPAILVFLRWDKVEPPEELPEPPAVEGAASLVAVVVLFALSRLLASYVNETVLDLSFIPVAWLAIRFGMRGAAAGVALAYLASVVASLLTHPSIGAVIASEALLFVEALMAWLLAAMTMERWDLLARLSRRAYVDDLTGLPNREKLIEWIVQHQDSPVVLVIMDVDDMRLLNQGVGRIAADHVLQEMAIRMRVTFPSSHFVARVSADEFAVAVVDDRSPHAIMAELRSFFEAPFDADGSRVFISVAMGAVRTIRTASPDELIRKADMALDRAKSSPSRAVVYTPELQAGETPSLVGELHRAVEHHELVPFFQPIFRFDRQSNAWVCVGAEALLRWMHPERGIVSPASFIDFLERLTIGDHVGWDVMERSLLQARAWRETMPDFRIWVNLFARQTLGRDCDRRIFELLDRTQVPAEALVVEINEGIVASEERDVAALVSRLRERGVVSAIDDFGTGGSSLGRVRDVPAAVLKIDRSFVNKSEVDGKAKAVAATVVRLANELGMTVLAEGVENAMQLDVMLETGCDLVQGYALGHPVPAELFTRTFIDADRAVSS